MTVTYDCARNAFVPHFPAKGTVRVHGVVPQLMFHVTNYCKLSCQYCFSEKGAALFPSREAERVSQKLRILGVQKVDISGGEPLLHEGLGDVVDALEEARIALTITTSGVVDAWGTDFLVRNASRFCRIIVSLDGPSKATHDSLRGHDCAWDLATKLLVRLVSSGLAASLRVNTVVTRSFCEGGWTRPMYELLASLHVREWCLIEPHPANRKRLFGDHAVSGEQFARVAEEADRHCETLEVLKRPRALFSEYFVLQPSACLVKHTMDSKDVELINLLSASDDDVRLLAATVTTVVPAV